MSSTSNAIQKVFRNTGRTLSRKSPTILTGLGVAGVITTTILAVRATPKALVLLDQYQEQKYEDGGEFILTDLDIIKAAWRCYIPTVIMGMVTITSIIAANSINLRRNAALVSLFTITQTAMREYQEKVIDTIGEKKEALIRGEVAQDRLNANPVNEKAIIITGDGDTLCYDAFSGRYFKSNIEKIKRLVNEFNRRLIIEDYLDINEFYDMLGLEMIKGGEEMGWRVDESLMDIKFSAKVATDGNPCLVLDYMVQPQKI